MVRIVRTPKGDILIDQGSRKIAGRGVYLCPLSACWEQGLKKNRLDHALRVPLSAEDRQNLRDFARTLDQKE